MTGHIIDTDSLIKLGLLLQSQVPFYNNLTTTQIVSTPTFPFFVNSNDSVLPGGDVLHGLFVAAFGPNVTAEEAPALVAQLDHSSKAARFVIPTIIGLALSCSAVLLRLWSRFLLSGRFRLEDYSITIGLIFIFAAQVDALRFIFENGAGTHQWDVTFAQFKYDLYISWVMYLLYVPPVMLFIKGAFLLFYYQLSTDKRFRTACVGVGILCFFLMWGDLFAHMFGCNWGFYNDPLNMKCADMLAIDKGFASLHIATDLMILLLPMTVVSMSSLPLRTKITLMIFFALGGVVCVITILRVLSLWAYVKAVDYTWHMLNTGILASVEANCAIILCCLPQLKQLVLYGKSRLVEYLLRHHHPDDGDIESGRPTPIPVKSVRTESLATAKQCDSVAEAEERKRPQVITETQPGSLSVQSRSLGSRIASHVASRMSSSRVGSRLGASKFSSTFTDTQVSTRIDEDAMAMQGLSAPPPPPCPPPTAPPRIRSWLNKMPDTPEGRWA